MRHSVICCCVCRRCNLRIVYCGVVFCGVVWKWRMFPERRTLYPIEELAARNLTQCLRPFINFRTRKSPSPVLDTSRRAALGPDNMPAAESSRSRGLKKCTHWKPR